MKRLGLLLTLGAALLISTGDTHAQGANFAVAAFRDGNPLEGFIGPFRATATGTDLLFTVLCVNVSPRFKAPREVVAPIPDGSNLATTRALSTTAVVDGCAEFSITVPRGAVLLPDLTFGQ